MSITAGEIVNWVVTLAASFSGAWFAFLYQLRIKDEEIIEKQVAAGNVGLIAMLKIIDITTKYNSDFISPNRAAPAIEFAIPPSMPDINSEISINHEALAFLIENKRRGLFKNTIEFQNRYEFIANIINKRTELFKSHIHNAYSKAGLTHEGLYDPETLKNVIGEKNHVALKQLTDAIVEQVDSSLTFFIQVKEDLISALKEDYPNHVIFEY